METSPDVVGIWDRLAARGPAVFLESAGEFGDANQWLIWAGLPEKEYFEKNGKAYLASPRSSSPLSISLWDFLDSVAESKPGFLPFPLSLSSAWFGVLSYEFGTAIHLRENRLRPFQKRVPDFYFFKPSCLLAVHRPTREYYWFGSEPFENIFGAEIAGKPFEVQNIKSLYSLSHYESIVRKAQDYIRQGDIYQANLAQVFEAHWKGGASHLYRTLRAINPGPFMGIFKGRNFTIVSSSPERLVSGKGNWLETRPIAGTRPRGEDELTDLQLKAELKTNAKEQAEHLMLVDLARNDLGRVAHYGTVEVKHYAEVESYAKVHHLVSTIQAQRRASASLSEILRSLFPGGTITGCPKIRCMEIIQDLENRPRGFYTGSMGYVAPGPCFDLNILIRSFTLFSNGELEFHAGAGIVADSDPQREYQETLYKVEALAQSLGGSMWPQT